MTTATTTKAMKTEAKRAGMTHALLRRLRLGGRRAGIFRCRVAFGLAIAAHLLADLTGATRA